MWPEDHPTSSGVFSEDTTAHGRENTEWPGSRTAVPGQGPVSLLLEQGIREICLVRELICFQWLPSEESRETSPGISA